MATVLTVEGAMVFVFIFGIVMHLCSLITGESLTGPDGQNDQSNVPCIFHWKAELCPEWLGLWAELYQSLGQAPDGSLLSKGYRF